MTCQGRSTEARAKVAIVRRVSLGRGKVERPSLNQAIRTGRRGEDAQLWL